VEPVVSQCSPYLRRSPLKAADRELQHYRFAGPVGGGDAVKIGLFAAIHGDEPAGAQALIYLIEMLCRQPELAEGYELFFYPVCNPLAFAAGTRLTPSGKDLNREFWCNSAEAEVRLLEHEIRANAFQGLISLHSDDTSDGLYGFVRGAVLTRALLEPALEAAEKILPRNRAPVIDGFPAENGIISQCYDGILTSPPELKPEPFEIIIETPQAAPIDLQVRALVIATQTVLVDYRKFLAFAANL
jgi:murein peptide amidase A